MSKLTEEELAMLTEEEREGYLDDDEEDGEGDDGAEGEGNEGAEQGQEGQGEEGEEEDDPTTKPDAETDEEGQEEDEGAQGADEGKEQDQQPKDEFTLQPKPLFNDNLPADIEAQRTAIDAKEDALDKQFDEGDITFSEHKKALRELNRERSALDRAELKAELSREAQAAQLDNSWQSSQAAFFASHPEINTNNEAQMAALDHLVRQETAAVLQKGGAIGVPELERAYAKFKEAFNIADPAPKQQQQQEKQTKKPKKETVVPPNLGKVPAAVGNETDDGKFAHLDRLADSDPLAFEDALSKMTDAQRDEYMRAG